MGVYEHKIIKNRFASDVLLEYILPMRTVGVLREDAVRKVVELGRALVTQPKLLFLDEPASGLNPEETKRLAFWIDDIRTDLGITVVMVEHDMSLVSSVADRVICMAQGKVLASGTAREVQSNPLVISAYLGT